MIQLLWACSLALFARIKTKIQQFDTSFSQHKKKISRILKSGSNHGWKGFHMIYHSTQSDD